MAKMFECVGVRVGFRCVVLFVSTVGCVYTPSYKTPNDAHTVILAESKEQALRTEITSNAERQGSVSGIPVVSANLRSTSFITLYLDESVEFYTGFLGYKVLGRSTVDAPKSRQVVGASSTDVTIRYVSMVPAIWSPERSDPAGISFVEITDAQASPFDQTGARPSRAGELILAHRVTNIDEIARRMRAANIPVVAPLGLSGSGKSRSMAVLDPNGIRVEMYEY